MSEQQPSVIYPDVSYFNVIDRTGSALFFAVVKLNGCWLVIDRNRPVFHFKNEFYSILDLDYWLKSENQYCTATHTAFFWFLLTTGHESVGSCVVDVSPIMFPFQRGLSTDKTALVVPFSDVRAFFNSYFCHEISVFRWKQAESDSVDELFVLNFEKDDRICFYQGKTYTFSGFNHSLTSEFLLKDQNNVVRDRLQTALLSPSGLKYSAKHNYFVITKGTYCSRIPFFWFDVAPLPIGIDK